MEDLPTRISPWLSVPDAASAVAFYRSAFGASELERLEEDDGSVAVALLEIDGATFWVQSDPDGPTALDGRSPVRMILTVADPDAVFGQALVAGAEEIAPVAEGYGWRIGRIADPAGHHWEIGRPLAP
jgi:PhnB protein